MGILITGKMHKSNNLHACMCMYLTPQMHGQIWLGGKLSNFPPLLREVQHQLIKIYWWSDKNGNP